MQQETKFTPKQIKLIIGFLVAAFLVIILAFVLKEIFRTNPFGEEIKIDNFSQYYNDTPQDRRDVVYHSLYSMVVMNNTPSETIPKSGAVIRDGSARSSFDESIQSHYGNFIVDIAEIEQSYRVQFGWTENKSDILDGDSVLITCINKDEVIYENFQCTDSLIQEEQEAAEIHALFPIMKDLPIKVEYYVNGNGAYIHYEIAGDLTYEGENEYSFAIVIDDYTQGNYDTAIQKIIDLGYNPDDYEIIYRVYDDKPAQAF